MELSFPICFLRWKKQVTPLILGDSVLKSWMKPYTNAVLSDEH